MSTINSANIQVGQSITPANNITLSTDTNGDLLISKGNAGALVEINRIKNSGMQDAAKVDYTPAGTGAVATTVQAKEREKVSTFDVLSTAEIAAIQAGTSGDLRSKLQQIITNSVGKTLIFNAGTYGMVPSADAGPTFGLCLDVPSNSHIVFEPGAVINLLAHNNTIYQMFRVWDKTNVTIEFPTLDGKKTLNSAVSGEFGMGIDIRGGSDITIINPVTNNMWGDGVYVGSFSATSSGVPKNVRVMNPYAYGCGRQGMSVTSADGLAVDNAHWEYIGTTAPSAGLDIEPDGNDAGHELKNIRITNVKTNNNTLGITLYLALLFGAIAKTVDIKITGHTDDGSTLGIRVGKVDTNGGAYIAAGSIELVQCVSLNASENGIKVDEYDALGPVLKIVSPTVVNCNRVGSSSAITGSPISVSRATGSVLTYAIGNVFITEPSIRLTSGTIPNLFHFQDAVGDYTKLQKCYFIDPVQISGVSNTAKYGVFRGSGNISDKYNVWNVDLTGSATVTDFNVAPMSANNASIAMVLGTGFFNAGAPDLIFKQPFTTSCIVQPDTGGNFVGLTTVQRLQSTGADAPGSYVRLRPLGSNRYLIVDRLGIWNTI